MRTITTAELTAILELHKKFLRDEEGGIRAKLRCANLRDTNLRDTNLSGADLRFANLRCSDLSGADLRFANLRCSDLRDTNLNGADLNGANLRDTNLRDANLRDTNLNGADLNGANLRDTNLNGADLNGADLSGADLSYANLRGANLSGAENLPLQIEENLIQKVAIAALASDNALEMNAWHICDTTHCIAGWAVTLAEKGKKLESKYGTEIAGLMLLGVEAHSHFFDSNEGARAYLSQFLQEETK